MKIKKLIEAAKKPAIYTQGTSSMWEDEYISSQLLKTHLSQNTDLASRKETTICSTVKWILDKVPGNRLRILDLGCGPGLYTEKLAESGHCVTGMDFSSHSISYAIESAKRKKLDISYIKQDYLKLEEENKYDLIVMIFTDFGVLPPDQRRILLKNIHRALKPGGTFLFDVLNENFPLREHVSKEWEMSEKGFWRNCPYLALTESFYYSEQNVTLNQHIIIDETGKMETYRFWVHTFPHAELAKIMSSAGFSTTKCYESVIPDSDMYSSESVTFCIANI